MKEQTFSEWCIENGYELSNVLDTITFPAEGGFYNAFVEYCDLTTVIQE